MDERPRKREMVLAMRRKHKTLNRCVICNKVSDISIETNVGDLTKGHFHQDLKHRENVICDECHHSVGKQIAENYMIDDANRTWNYKL